jgi:predicted dehydrogenase
MHKDYCPKFRTGIIGLGRIGFSLQYDKKREQPASHSAAFHNGDASLFRKSGTFLDGGFDISRKKRIAWSRAYPHARAYDKLSDMLSHGRWDIIVIAVDEKAHLEVFEKVVAVNPRLIVLEKPVAPNLKDARKIYELSRKHKVPVAVNHERRFSRDYIFVGDLIRYERMGELRMVTANILTSSAAWYKGDTKKARGALLHDATHIIDIAHFITGKKILMEAVSLCRKDKDKTHGISATGKIGKSGFIMNVGFETLHFMFELDLIFTAGRIRIGNGTLEVWDARESPFYEGFHSLIRDKSINPPNKTGYFSGMVENCIAFLKNEAPIVSSIKDGVAAIEAMENIMSLLEECV